MRTRLALIAATALAFCLSGCGGSAASSDEGAAPPAAAAPIENSAIAFVGVDVVPMDSEILLVDQTVVVRNRRIETVGLRVEVAVPADDRNTSRN